MIEANPYNLFALTRYKTLVSECFVFCVLAVCLRALLFRSLSVVLFIAAVKAC